ncbi:DUF4350 domain-containing protein [Luteimonas sp. 3794]|uniref:DUF4350 domain-containing protein n=1 Tax=Luteimonas sp. 3794 TaxID=2817730 RepID=UPI00285FEE00|nr:DUF4350 domain-containing protein [Luteimonas sp. 3794]MDR6992250.1 hypothetical protein [Luteimonas sp. 3794]
MRWPVRIALAALGALVIALGVGWFLHTHERVPETVDLPPRGEAAYNPLYALRETLRADGVEAVSRQRLQLSSVALGPRDTVLLYNEPRTLLPSEVETLLGWVDGGGHLLVRTPLPRKRTEQAVRAQDLLERVGVHVVDGRTRCEPLLVTGQGGHVEFCNGRRFLVDDEPLLEWGDGDEEGLVFARLAHGAGTIDVLADFDFMRNADLREVPHALLTRQLLAPNWGAGTVHLVYAASVPPLWYQILTRGWMAWGPLLLALLAWLWMRTQRLGPVLPAPPVARRALLEHVTASGEHLVRYGRAPLLYDAVRAAFLDRLRRRDPLAAALEGEAGIEAIAASTGLSPHEVRHALQAPRPEDAKAFRQRIARLVQMRNQL